jgi:16S rRNA (uracil1498-N3)-methyltransferase
MIRLFVSQPLGEGLTVAATADQHRYLAGVMRQGVGDAVLLFNGMDGEWQAELSTVGKRDSILTVTTQTRPQAASPELELVLALIKRTPLEWVVEKATELGVRRIRLVTTRRTNSDHTNVSRLQAIATEAAEQCARLDVPEIVPPQALERVLESWPADRPLAFCDETLAGAARAGAEAGQPLARSGGWLDAPAGSGPASGGVLIGPEGGFDPAETARLRAHPAVTPQSLGPRILRAETAAVAALTLWQATRGDWPRS